MTPVVRRRSAPSDAVIHQLLEGRDAKVTWNDRLSDPDNPQQGRQIDVTIRRNGKLTLTRMQAPLGMFLQQVSVTS